MGFIPGKTPHEVCVVILLHLLTGNSVLRSLCCVFLYWILKVRFRKGLKFRSWIEQKREGRSHIIFQQECKGIRMGGFLPCHLHHLVFAIESAQTRSVLGFYCYCLCFFISLIVINCFLHLSHFPTMCSNGKLRHLHIKLLPSMPS